MAQWYVKDLSKITNVSVQTLHHYDRIGLLKPSLRRPNGYRLYSEKDLIKLQQIIALKFFGFELSQIEKLLSGNIEMVKHFEVQAKFLEEKAKTLNVASQTLRSIISECSENKSIPWENVIKLIEVYRMSQQLEKTWVSQVLTPEEFKQYVNFEAGLKDRFSESDKKNFEDAWMNVVKEIGENLKQDPKSHIGMQLGKKVMDLINGLYGKEHANLKHSIWNKGFKKGHAEGEHAISPEIIEWMDKAIDAYYRKRIYDILDQVAINPTPELLRSWNGLLDEMYGNSDKLKQEFITIALKDERVNKKAHQWLQKLLD